MVMIVRTPDRAHTEWYEPCPADVRGRHLIEPLRARLNARFGQDSTLESRLPCR